MTTTSLLRLPVVRARTGLSRSSIYARVAAGTFPRPIAIGPRAVAWASDAVNTWIATNPRVASPMPIARLESRERAEEGADPRHPGCLRQATHDLRRAEMRRRPKIQPLKMAV